MVTDSRGRPADDVIVVIRGNTHGVTTTQNGEYWRVLPPGEYEIAVSLNDEFKDRVTKYKLKYFLRRKNKKYGKLRLIRMRHYDF